MIGEKTRIVQFTLPKQQFTTCWLSPAARSAVEVRGRGWVGGGFGSDRPGVVGFRGRRRQANNWPDLLPWAQLYAVPRATKVPLHSLHRRRDGFEQERRPFSIHYRGVYRFVRYFMENISFYGSLTK